ncbi:hypothetical protein EVJ58_g11091, partial [Rhodofomes roseus]
MARTATPVPSSPEPTGDQPMNGDTSFRVPPRRKRAVLDAFGQPLAVNIDNGLPDLIPSQRVVPQAGSVGPRQLSKRPRTLTLSPEPSMLPPDPSMPPPDLLTPPPDLSTPPDPSMPPPDRVRTASKRKRRATPEWTPTPAPTPEPGRAPSPPSVMRQERSVTPEDFSRRRLKKKGRLNKKAEAHARDHTAGMAAAAERNKAGSSKVDVEARRKAHVHHAAPLAISSQASTVVSWTDEGPTTETYVLMYEARKTFEANDVVVVRPRPGIRQLNGSVPERKTFTHWECVTEGARKRYQKAEDGQVVIDKDRLTLDRSLTGPQIMKVEKSILRMRKSARVERPSQTDEEKQKARGAKKHRRKVEKEAQKKVKRADRAALKAADKGKGKEVAEDTSGSDLSSLPASDED